MSDTRNQAALKQQIATTGSDPSRWIFGKRLEPTDDLLVRRGGGQALRIYEDLERDDQVGTVLQKRRLALVGREWSVEAGDESPEAAEVAELVDRALRGFAFDVLVEKLLGALLMGVAPVEIVWHVKGNELLPLRSVHINPATRITFHEGDDGLPVLHLLTKANTTDGEPVPERKFIVHRNPGRYDDPWGLALGSRLFWPVFFKRQGVGFWLGGLEKFGQPTAVGKYPNGTSDADQAKLLAALKAISSDTGVTIPDGMVVELLEAKRAGSFDSYATLVRYMDEAISKVVLGETLSTSTGANGNRALGEVHDGVRLEITKADGDRLAATLGGSLIPWIVELNRPDYAGPLPRLSWDVSEPEDLKARAERDKTLTDMGFEAEDDYIRDTYGDGWRRKAAPAAAPAAGPMPAGLAAAFAEAAAGRTRRSMPAADDGGDAAQDLAHQLEALALPAQEAMVARVAALVDGAASLPAIAEGLVALFPQLADDEFNALLGDALTLAALRGRADIIDQVG